MWGWRLCDSLDFFSLCLKMTAVTLTITFVFQAGTSRRGSVFQKFPGDICLFLIGHSGITQLPWVANVSGKVGLYLSSLYRRGRKGNWNKYYMSWSAIFATFLICIWNKREICPPNHHYLNLGPYKTRVLLYFCDPALYFCERTQFHDFQKFLPLSWKWASVSYNPESLD